MADLINLNGVRVVSGQISIPLYGSWVADLVLATPDPIPSAVTLTVGGLVLKGTVYRQDPFSGSRTARIVGGAGGWRKIIPAKGYSHIAGVKKSDVLKDAANETGETIVVASDTTIGVAFSRERDKAEHVLHLLTDGKWWIDNAGITQTGDRSAAKISSPFTVVDFSGAKGKFEIGTEVYQDWMPGRVFTNAILGTTHTISLSVIELGGEGKARVHVLSQSVEPERLLSSLRSIIRSEIAALTYSGEWEYTIVIATPTTIDAVPDDPRMPQVTNCPMAPGLMGETVTPSPGKKCRVHFVNMDPTRPEVIRVLGDPISVTIGMTNTANFSVGAAPQPVSHAVPDVTALGALQAQLTAVMAAFSGLCASLAAFANPGTNPLISAADVSNGVAILAASTTGLAVAVTAVGTGTAVVTAQLPLIPSTVGKIT